MGVVEGSEIVAAMAVAAEDEREAEVGAIMKGRDVMSRSWLSSFGGDEGGAAPFIQACGSDHVAFP